MPATFTSKPSSSKSRRYPDWTKIFALCPAKPGRDDHGLWLRGNIWYMFFYDEKRRTRSMCLHTTDKEEAKFRRDDIYKKAEKAGRGAKSKLQHYAQAILTDPATNHGLKFMVYFGGQVVPCSSLEEARTVRARIAREVLSRNINGRSSSLLPRNRKAS